MNEQTQNNPSFQKKVRWPLWGALATVILVLIVTGVSTFVGGLGPFASPIKFFIEEIILEELLGISDLFYTTYPYSLIFIALVSSAFYGAVVWFVALSIQKKKFLRLFLTAVVVVALLVFLFVHAFQLTFSENQCDPDKSGDGLIMRSCSGAFRLDNSIPKRMFEGDNPLDSYEFKNTLLTESELEELVKSEGNMAQFCSTGMGCKLRGLQCSANWNEPCIDCVRKCEQQERDLHFRQGSVYDLLKSESFIGCLRDCRSKYQK